MTRNSLANQRIVVPLLISTVMPLLQTCVVAAAAMFMNSECSAAGDEGVDDEAFVVALTGNSQFASYHPVSAATLHQIQ